MSKWIKHWIVAAALAFTGVAHAEAQLGSDYTLLNSAMPPLNAAASKIEVVEFFFYECPHCFHLHPALAKWEKSKPADVEISFVPTMFRPNNEPTATMYYALEGMGKIKQLDDTIYQAIHVNHVGLYDLDAISNFVAAHGVNKAEFINAYNSFSVHSKVERAKQLIRPGSYSIEGTPTLIVDGRYAVQAHNNPDDTIRVLNEIITKVRKERALAGKKH